MHLHLQFIRSLFCTSFFPYNFLLFSHGISFFFNYLSVSFPFIIQFIIIYSLLDMHLSSPLTPPTRIQTTTLSVLLYFHVKPSSLHYLQLFHYLSPFFSNFILPYPLTHLHHSFLSHKKNIRCGRHYKLVLGNSFVEVTFFTDSCQF